MVAALCAAEYGLLLVAGTALVGGLYLLALAGAYLLLILSACISFSSATREARRLAKHWFAFVFGYAPLAVALMLLLAVLVLIRRSAASG